MKRMILFTLAVLLVLSLAACGQSQNPAVPSTPSTSPTTEPITEPATEPPTEPTVQPATEPAPEDDPKLGSYQDGIYANSFLGLGCTLDESWTVYDKEELAQINGMVADAVGDETLAEMLRDSGVATLFFALADDGLVSMNITLENLGILYGTVMDEKTYAEISVNTLSTALESMGMSDVTAQVTSIPLAGAERTAVTVHGIISDVDVYETIVCMKVNNYMASLTVCCYLEDITSDLLSLFYALEG